MNLRSIRFLLLPMLAQAALFARTEDCFQILSMRKASWTSDTVPGDENRYQVVARNTCPYTIDAVYVMVRFTDSASHELSNGLWVLYFMPPGRSWTKKFSVPLKAYGFERVVLRKITTNAEEALRPGP